MKIPHPLVRIGWIALFAGLASLPAQTTQGWGNGDGTWDTTTANWSGLVWTNGNNATVGTSGARTGTITVDVGGVTVNNVNSGSGGGAIYSYALKGGPITLAGAASIWTVGGPSGSQLLVDSVIGGAGSLEKQGSRLLILAGDNTYTGGTTVTAGTLQIGKGGTSGSVAGNVAANAPLVFNRSDSSTYAGVISGSSTVTQAGTGTLVLTGNSVATGTLTVNVGALQLGGGGATGSYVGNIVDNGSVTFNRSDTLAYAGAISGTGGVTVAGTGTVLLNGANAYTGATTVNAGAALGGSGSLTSLVTVASGGALVGQSGQVFTTAGLTLSPTSNLKVALGAANSTGLFLVNGDLTLDGTLNVTNAGGFGPGLYRLIDYTGALTDQGLDLGLTGGAAASSLAIQTSVANQVNLFYDAGPANLWRGGAGAWNADPAGSGWTNVLGVVDQPWTPNFAIFQNAAATVTIDPAAGAVEMTGVQFAVDGYTLAGGPLTNNTADAVFRVGDGTTAGATMTGTISAPITGTGGLNKTDLGTLVLGGTNTYAGATAVTAGTLLVNGDQSGATGATTVLTGATLGGSGTLGGPVTVADGAALAGQGGQTLTMGSLALAGTSSVNVSLGAPSATALFQVNGDLTLDGTLNVTNAGGFGPGLYRIIGYTGTLANNGLAFGTAPVATNLFSLQTSVSNEVNLIFSAGANNLWRGGAGVWSADPGSIAWTESSGNATTFWTPNFAIFQNAAATVTIDPAAGAVEMTGVQFAVDGYTLAGGALTDNTADAVFRVGDGTTAGATMTGTISAPITGTGGLNKTDLGTLVLGGTNTYAGATAVTGGTLLVNGDQSGATGATTVLTGATLGGSGTLGGPVTVADGAALAGQSGQMLTMGSLTLAGTSSVNVSLGAPSTTTLFQVNGDLTLDGTLNLSNTSGFGSGLYRLFNYTGTLTDQGLGFGTTAGRNPSGFSLMTTTANQVSVLYQDLDTPLPLWTGGSGVWNGNPAGSGFVDSTGAITGGWRPGFAIFQGAPGTVTVDASAGPVVVTGIQFAVDGYAVTGEALTNNTAAAVFRVGDGTAAGAAMTGTISAPVTGSGGLNKTDFGTLVLSGPNTYAGGTAVSGGILRVASDANLGDAAGGVTLDGGTLQASAGFASARPFVLGAGGGVIDPGANALTLSGVITGAGGLTKAGSGQLTLSGANAYTGATTISAGTLMLTNSSVSATTVASGAVLAGNGMVRGNLVNNGRVSPGASPGVITVTGNYTQSPTGSYAVEIASGTSFDQLSITGTATLGGSLVVTGLNGFVPAADQSFTVLTAAGGVTGTFASVASPWGSLSPMLAFRTLYHSNDVMLTLAQLPFGGLAGTAGQAAVGGAVDRAIAGATIPMLRGALNAVPTQAGVLAALSQLSPRRYERWFDQALTSTDATVRTMENRLAARTGEPPSGLWMELTRWESRFDATDESTAAKADANGLQVGGDTSLTSAVKLGLLFGYTDENISLDEAGSTTAAKRYSGGLYLRYDASPVQVEMTGGVGGAKLDSRRTIAIPGYAGVAEGQANSFETFASMRVGYPVAAGAASLMPYAAVKFMHWSGGDFKETGAGEADLNLLSQFGKSLATRVGFTLARTFTQASNHRLTVRADVAWRNEFQDSPRDIGATLGGSSFTVPTSSPSRSGFTAGVSLNAEVTDQMNACLRLTAENSTAADRTFAAQAGLAYRF